MTAPLRNVIAGVPVSWSDTPFGAYTGRVYLEERPAGQTIAQIVASIPGLPASFAETGTACVNGEPVPKALWAYVRPRTHGPIPISVTLHVGLRGGGRSGSGGSSSKSPFAIIASIALLALTTFVSAGFGAGIGGWFAAGSFSARALGLGIGLAGSLLIAALSPPPTTKTGANSQATSPQSASADGNQVAPGGTIPRVLGTFRVFPNLLADPLVEIIGETEVITAVYGLGGPHQLNDIQAAGASVASSNDLVVETREGWPTDRPLTLATRQSITALPQLQVSEHAFAAANGAATDFWTLKDAGTPTTDLPVWHSLVTRSAPDEAWLHLYFSSGLYDSANVGGNIGVPIRVQIRQYGAASWINLPEVHLTDNRSTLIRRAIKIMWGTAPAAIPLPPTTQGWWLAFKSYPAYAPTSDPGWTAHSSFSTGSGDAYFSSANATTTTGVKNVRLYSDRAEFYLDPNVFPQIGPYEIRIMRGGSYTVANLTPATPSLSGVTNAPLFTYISSGGSPAAARASGNTQSTCMLPRVVSVWNAAPIRGTDIALIAIQGTNRAVSQISTLASGYVRDWDGTGWNTWTTTSNPAPHFRDVLAGNLTRWKANKVDDATLADWRQHCTDMAYTFDAIVDGKSMSDVLTLLASAGYARPAKSETWGVIQDRDRSLSPVAQIFSPRNLSSFRWEKAFANLPDGFVITFRDKALNYQQNQTVVYRSGYTAGSANVLETVDYIGPVTVAAAQKRGLFDLAQAVARSTFYTADADIESIVTRSGDLVGVQHDVIDKSAGFARIKSILKDGTTGNITGLQLDSTVPVQVTSDFFAFSDVFSMGGDFFNAVQRVGIAMRLRDGTIQTKEIVAGSGETDTVQFAAPFADPGAPLAADCMVTSGSLGVEFHRLLISGIQPGADLAATLTFVDEAPELWAMPVNTPPFGGSDAVLAEIIPAAWAIDASRPEQKRSRFPR